MKPVKMSQCLRRLHLDFHNPVDIPDLCVDFNAKEFAATIREAGFDSVTVFALDSHGHCYYPTRCGKRHPQLAMDLLGAMLDACHQADLLVGAYIAVGAGDDVAPEWCQVNARGRRRSFEEQGGYQLVCLNSPHIEQNILPITEEVVRQYPIDCVFYDLLYFFDEGCHCPYCLARLQEWGLKGDSAADWRELTRRTVGVFAERTAQCIRRLSPTVEITYNTMSLHERPAGMEQAAYLDVESPATGGWGYFYFPPRGRYLRTLGIPVAGMTVAFHKAWGDFGTLKSKAQLEHECYTNIAAAAAVGIGDQLPPRGRLEKERYQRIGAVLNPIREMEPWIRDAQPMAEAAIVLPPLGQGQFPSPEWSAATKVLLEGKVQFDTVDLHADWSRYQVLILPDLAPAPAECMRRLADYVSAGGAVLATGKAVSALPDHVFRVINPDYSPTAYLKAGQALQAEIGAIPLVVYSGFLTVEAEGAQVLATLTRPYPKTQPRFFFSSQIPYAEETSQGVLFQKERIVYSAAPLFREYWQTGNGAHRQILLRYLRSLLPAPLVQTNAPLSWEVALLRQGPRRICVVVPFAPLRTGQLGDQIKYTTPQIDDWTPMANLRIRVAGCFSKAFRVPNQEPLTVAQAGKYSEVVIPEATGPLVIVLT